MTRRGGGGGGDRCAAGKIGMPSAECVSVCAHVGVNAWLRAKALSSAFCNALPLSVSALGGLHNTALCTAWQPNLTP